MDGYVKRYMNERVRWMDTQAVGYDIKWIDGWADG